MPEEPDAHKDIVLVVVAGPRKGLRFQSRGRTAITIGRSKTADFHIVDTTMSRVHAVVRRQGGQWHVADQKSRNGVWVDGDRVERHDLGDKDVFWLGKNTRVEFIMVESGAVETGEVPVRLRCHKCGESIESVATATRGVDGHRYHLECRNLDHLVGSDLGEFRVLDTLAPLGDGFFFKAHQATLNRTLVLQAFDPPLTKPAGFRDSLLEEVRRVSRFLHPNLLQIYDFGEARGMAFVAMEYFQGDLLSTVLQTRHYVKIRGAVSVALRLLEGLQYTLEQGSLLPWMSPKQVLVSDDHEVKLVLFREPSRREAKPGLDEAAYVAPEVLTEESRGGDETALVYSVGTILYHMLAAIPPFEGSSVSDIARQAHNQSPPALRRINLKVSPALARVVETAIHRMAEERHETLREFLEQLRKASGLSR